MSNIDQTRAYLSFRSEIEAIKHEFGEDVAWDIIYHAIKDSLIENKFTNIIKSIKRNYHA